MDSEYLKAERRRWEKLTQVFEGALECDPANRSGFVRIECGTDAALVAEVNRLLVEHELAEDFLLEPMALKPQYQM